LDDELLLDDDRLDEQLLLDQNELLLEDESGQELLLQELDDQLLGLLGYQLLLDENSAMSRKPSQMPRILLCGATATRPCPRRRTGSTRWACRPPQSHRHGLQMRNLAVPVKGVKQIPEKFPRSGVPQDTGLHRRSPP